MKKKGQISFGNAPNVVIALVFLGLIAAAGVIAMSSMKNGITTADYGNSTTQSLFSTANDTLDNTISSISNFSSQLGTVGTMLGVGLLVVVVLAIFAFRMNRSGGGL